MSDNHRVNDAVLVIINDGNGKQCGYTYDERCKFTDLLLEYRQMVRNWNRYNQRVFEGASLTKEEIEEAARELQAYYVQHMKERSQ